MDKLKRANLEKKNVDILVGHASVNSRLARSKFSRLINNARIEKEVVVITDHGEPAAAIVPISDLRLLDKLAEMKWKDKISNINFKVMNRAELREFLLGDGEVKDGNDSQGRGDENVGSFKAQK